MTQPTSHDDLPADAPRPSILQLGVGAMGGVFAARLIEAGHNLTLVAGNRMADAINARGISLLGDGAEWHRSTVAYPSVADVPPGPAFDIVLILTKAMHLVDAATQARTRAHESTLFLALQNGIVEPLIVPVVGRERVIPSLLNWAATMVEPGVYRRTAGTATFLGEYSGEITPRLRVLATVLECVAPVSLSTNILGAQWSKLEMNCAVTALGALAGAPLSKILASEHGRSLFLDTCREVLDVADAENVKLETLAVKPYVPHSNSPDEIETWLTKVLAIYGGSLPSIVQDIQRGRQTEIDFLSGYVAQRAEAHGIHAPLCRGITQLIHEVEAGRRVLEIGNLVALRSDAPRAIRGQ